MNSKFISRYQRLKFILVNPTAEISQKIIFIEEFKSSGDFQEAVEDASSKYFDEGFDFCKRQLRRHHLELDIDLEGMELDLEEEEGEQEEERRRGKGERYRGK